MFGASNTGFGGFGQQNQQQNQQNQPAAGGGLFGNTSGGFGSSFGASSTPAFGTPAQQPAQNTGFGGFGANTSTTPAFGANTSATPAFGSTPSAGGGLFGNTANASAPSTGFSFGGGTSAFGSNTNTAAGSTGGGLFGAAKPATTGFGGFGQPAQPSQPQQPATGGGLFGGGASAGGFGAANNFSGQANGTASAPYQPTQVLEPPAEEGKPPPASQTAHNFQSITCMPQYKNYSFEELRLQDYQANRKGPSATPGFGGSFGASSTPAFGAPAASTTGGGLFGSSSTPAFGAAPAAPTTGFGAAPASGGGLFGSSGTSAFGQPATSQPAAGGGLFGAAPAQPAAGGLFGSTTGTGGFGQPAAPAATPAFGGFGASQNKPATTGFSFGSNNTTTPASTGGGLFGSTPAATSQPSNPFGQPAAPATGGGLFGSAQPASSAAPSFSFGASASKPLFGSAAPATSAPAFGASAAATAPKPAFSFGQPATGATGGGLFGNTNAQSQSAAPAFGSTPAPATGGGLFGGSTFGQPTQNAASTGLGGGLFGAKPAQPATGGGLFGSTAQSTGGGLFGSTNQNQPQQQPSLFGSTAPSGGLGGSLFGGGASTNQQQGQPQQIAYASSEDPNAYGSNPLFANAGNSPARPVEEKKKPPIFTAFRGTPVNRSSTKITRLRGFGLSAASSPAAGASPLAFSSGVGSSSLSAPLGTPARASPLRLGNGLSDEVVLSPNAFVSRPSVKKLVIGPKTGVKSFNSPSRDGSATPGRSKVTFNPEVEVPSRSSLFGASLSSRAGAGSAEDETSFALSEGPDGNTAFDSPSLNKTAAAADWPIRRAPAASSVARAPKHGDYLTVPSLETLRNFPAAKLRAVPDLVIGRVGFGQVAFSEPVDLTTLDTIEDLLGGIVRLEDRNATVYPEEYEDIKPPSGEGLNVPATITLENCFPLDKSTRKPIKDAQHPRVQQHVKRLRNLDGTEFVDFDAETGKWTFDVREF